MSCMAELFQSSKQNIAKHLKAIFVEAELSADAVVNQWLTTAEAARLKAETEYANYQQQLDAMPAQVEYDAIRALESVTKKLPKSRYE